MMSNSSVPVKIAAIAGAALTLVLLRYTIAHTFTLLLWTLVIAGIIAVIPRKKSTTNTTNTQNNTLPQTAEDYVTGWQAPTYGLPAATPQTPAEAEYERMMQEIRKENRSN